ncbi:MAG: acyloxyacyl hydrolase [Rhodospirillales bacterium]|nr:acyloxyacyl hydrolase [Rhodospirillales bacterium]
MAIRKILLSMAALGSLLLSTAPEAVAADDADFLRVGAGWWDFNRPDNYAAEFDIAYRSDYKWWFLKHQAGLLGTSDGSAYGYWGLYMDLYFGNRFVVSPSTAVGYYYRGAWDKGDKKSNLGSPIEFRSGIDFSYRFDDRSRVGLGVYHISNTGLWSDRNPGEETLMLSYDIPISKLYSGWKSPGGNSPAAQSASQPANQSASVMKAKPAQKR